MIIYKPVGTSTSIDKVHLVSAPTENNPPQEIQSKINSLWETESTLAEQQGKQLFDSPVFTFKSLIISEDSNELQLAVSSVSYKVRYIAKKYPVISRGVGKIHALFTHILLSTTDGFYIFGNKSNNYVTDLSICFIGGTLNNIDSLAAHAYEELDEELGLSRSDVAYLHLAGIYENSIGNTGLVINGTIAMSSDEIKVHFDNWHKNQSLPELGSIIIIPASDLSAFLNKEFSAYPDVHILMCG